jgi:hypothetical protein
VTSARRLRGAWIASVLLAAGCGGSDRKLDRSRQAVASWASSVRLAAADWARGANPTRFTRTVLEAAREELESEEKQLRRGRYADRAGTLGKDAARVRDIAERILEAVGRGDRAGAVATDAALSEVSARLSGSSR